MSARGRPSSHPPRRSHSTTAVADQEVRIAGISNLGSTCFVGASLQALGGAVGAFSAICSLGSFGEDACVAVIGDAWANGLLCLVTTLMKAASPADGDAAVRPEQLQRAMAASWCDAQGSQTYRRDQQMDAAEFLLQCIERVGPLRQQLTFSLTAKNGSITSNSILHVPITDGASLEALIHYEYARDDEPGALRLSSYPNLLLVQLTRFARRGQTLCKDRSRVRVNETLRLFDEAGGVRARYALKGVVAHLGETLQQGHYVADSVRIKEGQPRWFHFNDDNVTQGRVVDELDAYLLVFEFEQELADESGVGAELEAEVGRIRFRRHWPTHPQRAEAVRRVAELRRDLGKLITAQNARELIEPLVRCQVASSFSDEVAELAMLDELEDGERAQSPTTVELHRDIEGLEMWNDRTNWRSTAVTEGGLSLVVSLVHRIIACAPIFSQLLRYRLDDPNSTIFVHRPEQSGKTFACVLLAWLSNLCYGQAAYILLRSGSAAAEDYFKFEQPVKQLNQLIWRHLVGFSFELDDHGREVYTRLPDEVFSQRLLKDDLFAFNDTVRRAFMQAFVLHSNHLHTGDKSMTSESAQHVRQKRYPLVYSRLSTPGNIERACQLEIHTLVKDYGVDEHGFANLTLLVDEYQQNTKVGTRVHEVMHWPLLRFGTLRAALEAGLEMPASASNADRKAELKRRFERRDAAFGDEMGDRSSRSHFSACLKGQVRISATTVSGQLHLEQYDAREPKALELGVDEEYYGDKTAKNIVDGNQIQFEWRGGSDLGFLDEDCADGDEGPVPPAKLQRFCLDEFRMQLEREGYSHVLLQAISSRNNANMFEWAKFFIDYANQHKPEVPVVAVTAYMYTTAGCYPGGPWLIFSDAALMVREHVPEVAQELFVSTDKKGDFRRPGCYGDKIALNRGGEIGSAIRQMMLQRSNPSLANCIQLPKNGQLYLPKLLRLLHESLERASVDKRQLKVLTIGKGVLNVGMTPKTDHHKMGVTLGLISATERQISNLSGEELSQGLAGRIAGPRSGDEYWDARGNDDPPRIVTSASFSVRLEAARFIQAGVMQTTAEKAPGQLLNEAINQRDFVGIHPNADDLAVQYKGMTIRERNKRLREDPDFVEPGRQLLDDVINNSTHGKIGALPAGFMTQEEEAERHQELLRMYDAAEDMARGTRAEGKMPRVNDEIYTSWNKDFPYYPARVIDLQWTDDEGVAYMLEYLTSEDDITVRLPEGQRTETRFMELDLDMNEWSREKPDETTDWENRLLSTRR